MFESVASVGLNHLLGRHARNYEEIWIGELIDRVRDGKVNPPENTTLHRFAWYRDLEGNLLDTDTAAVEVINILRPIVAIAIFINFTALAVHHYPEEREKLESGNEKYAQMFVQEVRRFYPFFPFVVALVKKDFTWKGYNFEEGTLTFWIFMVQIMTSKFGKILMCLVLIGLPNGMEALLALFRRVVVITLWDTDVPGSGSLLKS